MSQILVSYVSAPAAGNLEIRACKAPPNPHRWVFMWAIVESMPDGETRVLTGTGMHGHPGAITMDEALTAASRAFESVSLTMGAA